MHPTIIVIILELVIAVIILRILTGRNNLVPKLSSSLIRLTVGGLSALGAYAIMASCISKYGRMCHEELIAGTFFAFSLLALCLIPLGAVQTLWVLFKRSSYKMEINHKIKHNNANEADVKKPSGLP